MAPPKVIIARTAIENNKYQICLFRRYEKAWHIKKILVEEAPLNFEEAKKLMVKFSEELGVFWQKRLLKDASREKRKRAERNAKRAALKLLKKSEKLPVLSFDGSSKGRSGEAVGAAVIQMPDNTRHTVSKFLPCANNNEAEYTGLIIGLEKAIEMGISKIDIKGDSQVVIYQVLKKLPVNLLFQNYYEQVHQLLSQFEVYSFTWIPRAKNQLADRVAHLYIKNQSCKHKDS